MAEYGEWIRKGAVLSDVTAKKEYRVSRDFIIEGIKSGKLEYREGSVWGNPYFRLLRKQLEDYISDCLGEKYLTKVKSEVEFKIVKKDIPHPLRRRKLRRSATAGQPAGQPAGRPPRPAKERAYSLRRLFTGLTRAALIL